MAKENIIPSEIPQDQSQGREDETRRRAGVKPKKSAVAAGYSDATLCFWPQNDFAPIPRSIESMMPEDHMAGQGLDIEQLFFVKASFKHLN